MEIVPPCKSCYPDSMRPTTVTSLEPYEDANGNHIDYDGPGLSSVSITFRGKNAVLQVDPNAFASRLIIDFNGDNGRLKIGSNSHHWSFAAAIRVGQDSVVTIGDDVSSTAGVIISAVEGTRLTIGNDVMFASANQVRADDAHPIFDVRTGKRINVAQDIRIRNHVWFAWGAIALGGAEIGDGSVLGMNSLLNSAVPNNCVIVGSPARVVRRDIAWERPHLGLTPPFYKMDASTIKTHLDYWNLTQEGASDGVD